MQKMSGEDIAAFAEAMNEVSRDISDAVSAFNRPASRMQLQGASKKPHKIAAAKKRHAKKKANKK